jgi:hypothetical protein
MNVRQTAITRIRAMTLMERGRIMLVIVLGDVCVNEPRSGDRV